MPSPLGINPLNINTAQHDRADVVDELQAQGAATIQHQLGNTGGNYAGNFGTSPTATATVTYFQKPPTASAIPDMPTRADAPTSVEEVLSQSRELLTTPGAPTNRDAALKLANTTAAAVADEEAPYFNKDTGRWTVPVKLNLPVTPVGDAGEWATPGGGYGASVPPPPPAPDMTPPPSVSAPPPKKKPSIALWAAVAAVGYYFTK